mmetsp:Transcript_64266/g.152300  ORF Transcript_64266/g.152300 Transcript_64266/m.152300 type:complete len:269 (-) Transcript_64266:92-898(-)
MRGPGERVDRRHPFRGWGCLRKGVAVGPGCPEGVLEGRGHHLHCACSLPLQQAEGAVQRKSLARRQREDHPCPLRRDLACRRLHAQQRSGLRIPRRPSLLEMPPLHEADVGALALVSNVHLGVFGRRMPHPDHRVISVDRCAEAQPFEFLPRPLNERAGAERGRGGQSDTLREVCSEFRVVVVPAPCGCEGREQTELLARQHRGGSVGLLVEEQITRVVFQDPSSIDPLASNASLGVALRETTQFCYLFIHVTPVIDCSDSEGHFPQK